MSLIDLSRYFVFLTSILITYGLYMQGIKIFRTKSAKDFTLVLLLTLLINEFAWLFYGIILREWPMIALGLLNLPAEIIMAVGYSRYK